MASFKEADPASFNAIGSGPLEFVDLLGRNKVVAAGLAKSGSSPAAVQKIAHSAFARIERNDFKFKSLSSWSYNIAVGCGHACRFCYVVGSQQTGPGKEGNENTGPLATTLREYGILDPDADWGKYVLFRPWDEKKFMASLRRAESTPPAKLNADGNRAVIMCSTTDPYQTIVIKGNPVKQNLLNHHARFLVRRALELILEHSTLNVRILTRSPLAKQDFDLYKKFGNRLIFGMSLPTLRQDLLNVYEPQAPSAQARLRTLLEAAKARIPLFVAVAPTYPDLGEEDIRAVLEAIKPLNPLTIFHEPINIRAENVERIAAHARDLGVDLRTDVFKNGSAWRNYAVEQLMTVQRIATELGIKAHLHLWPDKSLRSQGSFMKARQAAFRQADPKRRETKHEKKRRLEQDEVKYREFLAWLAHWHQRISEWPGKRHSA
jgi:DNA repair photolyase